MLALSQSRTSALANQLKASHVVAERIPHWPFCAVHSNRARAAGTACSASSLIGHTPSAIGCGCSQATCKQNKRGAHHMRVCERMQRIACSWECRARVSRLLRALSVNACTHQQRTMLTAHFIGRRAAAALLPLPRPRPAPGASACTRTRRSRAASPQGCPWQCSACPCASSPRSAAAAPAAVRAAPLGAALRQQRPRARGRAASRLYPRRLK